MALTVAERRDRDRTVALLAERSRRLAYDAREEYAANPLVQFRAQSAASPAEAVEVVAVERRLGLSLPQPYVEHLTTVANGGYGPGSGLKSLSEACEATAPATPFSFSMERLQLGHGALHIARYPDAAALLIVTVDPSEDVDDSSRFAPGDIAILYDEPRRHAGLFRLDDGEEVHGSDGAGDFAHMDFDRWYDDWVVALEMKIARAERRNGDDASATSYFAVNVSNGAHH